ncbi:MAG: hypothetical protein LUG18_00320 [Candidatus Azobacteroides sp.]|nr:hypothetical protein [Candidatus Azobacteroides sp.]
MGYKVIVLCGVLLLYGLHIAYAGPENGWALPAVRTAFEEETSVILDAEKKSTDRVTAIFSDQSALVSFDKDEDPSASAPPPGGGRPQKVPLGGYEIGFYFFLTLFVYAIRKSRKNRKKKSAYSMG